MSVKIKELDLGWKEIQHNIIQASSKVAVVGIIGGGEELEKAVANEFGTDKIPERPFMRQTFDKVAPEIQKKKKEGMNQMIFDGVKPSKVLSRIGNFYRQEIRNAIANKEFKPNSASTIKRKGSETPLLDTGKMQQSLQVEIRDD